MLLRQRPAGIVPRVQGHYLLSDIQSVCVFKRDLVAFVSDLIRSYLY